MKALLLGIQSLSFPDKETGKTVEMTKLHVVSPAKENTSEMQGQRCEAIGTTLNCSKLEIGKVYNFVYERPLGAGANAKAKLVEIFPA